VEDRPLAERALHRPERGLDPREQDVGPPVLPVVRKRRFLIIEPVSL
jgi:hypothetical protein